MNIACSKFEIVSSTETGETAIADILLCETGMVLRGVRLCADLSQKICEMTLPPGCELVDPWCEHAFKALVFRAVAIYSRQNPIQRPGPLSDGTIPQWMN